MRERTSYLLVASFLLIALPVRAQGPGDTSLWHMTKVSLTSGQGALTSGLDAAAAFEKGSRTCELVLNKDRGYVVCGINREHYYVGAHVAFFKGIPNIGPRVDLKLGRFSTIHWFALSAGEPDFDTDDPKPELSLNFFTFFNAIYIDLSPITLSYSHLFFQNEIFNMPGISLNVSASDHMDLVAGLDYLRESETPLFRIGGSYTF